MMRSIPAAVGVDGHVGARCADAEPGSVHNIPVLFLVLACKLVCLVDDVLAELAHFLSPSFR